MLTPQVNYTGLYASPVIKDRFQVMESNSYPGKYYIYDHKFDRIIRSQKSDYFELFVSTSEAVDFINKIGDNDLTAKVLSAIPRTPIPKGKSIMSKTSNRGESALSYMKELIGRASRDETGELVDTSGIFDAVQARFPENKYTKHYVKYMDKEMRKKAAKAG